MGSSVCGLAINCSYSTGLDGRVSVKTSALTSTSLSERATL